MAEEHVQGRPPPLSLSLSLSLSPFESDQTAFPSSPSDPSTATYDMDIGAGDHSLPLGFNIVPPQELQQASSPEQRLSPMDSSSAFAPPLGYQPFGVRSTPNPASVRPFASKAQPNSRQPKHTYASPYHTAPLASSNMHQAESYRSYPQTQPQTQMHAPEVARHNQSPSHGSPAQRAGAPTDTHLPNPGLLANETEDLLYPSYELAKAERDRLFLQPLEVDGDDVEEVDQHKSKYVLDLTKALNRKDFLPPPKTKNPMRKDADEMSEEDKAKWVKWQKIGQQDFETHLSDPKFKDAPEWNEIQYRAWKVVTDAIRVHREGFEPTKQKKNETMKRDETLKCSTRLEEADRIISGYSRVRHKILKGDNIPNFCISPQAYVEVTIAAYRNNSGRPRGTKKAVSDAVPSAQVVEKDESGARGPGKGRKKTENKKSTEEPAKKKRKGAGGSKTAAEESTSFVSSENIAKGSSFAAVEGGGEDEDAEGEFDDTAIAEQLGNNAAPTFNSTDYRQGVFGYVPGIPYPHDNDAYQGSFGNISASMPSFRPQTQPNPRGPGTSGAFGLATQLSPVSATNYAMFSARGFGSSTTIGAGLSQNSSMHPPHGLPSAISYPENNIDYTITGHPSAGFPSFPGPQSDNYETPSSKRRRL